MKNGDAPRGYSHALPQVCVTAVVIGAFLMSILTLNNYVWWDILDGIVRNLLYSYGIPFDLGTLLLIVAFLALIAGITSNVRVLRWALRLGTIMFVPSLLYYSQIDWMYIVGIKINLAMLKNDLPEAYTLCNGIILIAAAMMLRSHVQLMKVREMLEKRGALPEDIDIAVGSNYRYVLFVTGISALATLAMAATITAITPYMYILTSLGAYSYLVIGLVCGLAVVIIFGGYIWASGKRDAEISEKKIGPSN